MRERYKSVIHVKEEVLKWLFSSLDLACYNNSKLVVLIVMVGERPSIEKICVKSAKERRSSVIQKSLKYQSIKE